MTEKELKIHEDDVVKFNALSESETAPSKTEIFLQEAARTVKKAFCVVTPIGLAVVPNVISPPAIHAQMTQQEITRELNQVRQEIQRLEREINQRQPQIDRLAQQFEAFRRNPENKAMARQALGVAVRNETEKKRALSVWQQTHRPEFRSNFCQRTFEHEIDRRRELAEDIHLNSIHRILEEKLPNKIILPLLEGIYFENPSPGINAHVAESWDRDAHLPRDQRMERAGDASAAASRNYGRMIGMNIDVNDVQCRIKNTRLVALRNQQRVDRSRLEELQRRERQLTNMQTPRTQSR